MTTNVNLYAVCSWAKYDVVYHSCGGSSTKTDASAATYGIPYATLSYGDLFGASDMSGWHFVGWSTSDPASLPTINTYTMDSCVSPKRNKIHLYAYCERNIIRLKWNPVNGTMSDTNPQSCTYGITAGNSGDISTVYQPSLPGYDFKGWLVNGWGPCTLANFSNQNCIAYYARSDVNEGMCSIYDPNNGINGTNNVNNCSNSTYANEFSDLDQQFTPDIGNKWKIEFSDGVMYGESKCSSTAGSTTYGVQNGVLQNPTVDIPSDALGGECWCKVSSYVLNGSSTQCNIGSYYNEWVYFGHSATAVCKKQCANNCASAIGTNWIFRTPFFAAY